MVTGAGNTCCTKAGSFDEVPSEYLDWYVSRENQSEMGVFAGFSSLTATKDNLTMKFYDQGGNELYTTKPISPRRTAIN